ncbi:hypothetical protein [Streptomyces bauhiniae]
MLFWRSAATPEPAAPEEPSAEVPAQAPGEVPATFSVIVTSAGDAFLDGARVRPPADVDVTEAVLHILRQHARTGGRPVLGAVEDRRERYAAVFEVTPNGASRLLESSPLRRPGPPFASAPGSGPAHTPEDSEGDAGAVPAAPGPDQATLLLRTVPTPPSPPASGQGTPAVPEPLTGAVSRIREALVAGDLSTAGALTHVFAADVQRSYGADHPYALEALGMRGYVQFLLGEYDQALILSLRVAEARHSRGEPDAWRELVRAALSWRSLESSEAGASHARHLAEALDRIGTHGVPPGREADLLRETAAELRALPQP